MTICVSVKIAEGLIFAADSVTAIHGEIRLSKDDKVGQKGTIQTFEYANKVTQLSDPIGVMSWGQANINSRTIQSLIMEFELERHRRESTKPPCNVKDIALELIDFIGERYKDAYLSDQTPPIPPQNRVLGIIIGGYSDGQFFPEQYVHYFNDPRDLEELRPDLDNGSPSFGLNWFGLSDALVRLIKGYEPASLNNLVSRGVDAKIIQNWVDDNVSELPLVFDGMPLQDAIDFAAYCIQVVIGRYRFGPGDPLCGGDIDIAVIRPGSFEWAQRKEWAIKDY